MTDKLNTEKRGSKAKLSKASGKKKSYVEKALKNFH